MAKFTYYALALPGTNLYLPESMRQVDFAKVSPTASAFPRLFKNKGVAEIAKGAWEKFNPGQSLEVCPMQLESL